MIGIFKNFGKLVENKNMQVTDKDTLIITIDGKTKLLTREEIINAFRDKTQYQKNMEAVQKDWDERLRQNNCANYERDNNLSEMEQNIKDYFATMPGRFKIHDKEYELTDKNFKDILKEIFNEPKREIYMMNADTVIDSKSSLFLKKQPCQDPIVESVRQKLLDRSNVGIKKYNTTLESNNKDNYLNHLQQELMDGSLYIQKIMQQEKDITELVASEQNDWELGKLIRKKYGK